MPASLSAKHSRNVRACKPVCKAQQKMFVSASLSAKSTNFPQLSLRADSIAASQYNASNGSDTFGRLSS